MVTVASMTLALNALSVLAGVACLIMNPEGRSNMGNMATARFGGPWGTPPYVNVMREERVVHHLIHILGHYRIRSYIGAQRSVVRDMVPA